MPTKTDLLDDFRVFAPSNQFPIPEFLKIQVERTSSKIDYGNAESTAEYNKFNQRFLALRQNWMSLNNAVSSIFTVPNFFAQHPQPDIPFVIGSTSLFEGKYSLQSSRWAYEVTTQSDLEAILNAVNHKQPFEWTTICPKDFTLLRWHHNRTTYLFGNWLWVLKNSELLYDYVQIKLLLLKEHDKEKRNFEFLAHKFSRSDATDLRKREPIPDDVRIFVWKRDNGRCVRCGSNRNLEFDHIVPHSKGGSDTARNLQLLCEGCNREKSDLI
jgi:hypothetical protein